LALDWVSMNVVPVIHEVLVVANSVIGESSFPDFPFAAEDVSERVGVSALDELNGMFERYAVGGSEQEMNVFRHQGEGVELITALAAISILGLQEKAGVVFDHEQSSTLPGGESREIGSGRGDESARLQEQTSAAKAAIFA